MAYHHPGDHIGSIIITLRWRHNGRDYVSNHQPHDCLLNRLSYANQRKHQSSASLAFVRGIHREPVNSPHKWPVTRKMSPFDDVIMEPMNNLKILHRIRSKYEELHWLVITSRCRHVFKLLTVPLRTYACQTAEIMNSAMKWGCMGKNILMNYSQLKLAIQYELKARRNAMRTEHVVSAISNRTTARDTKIQERR